MSYNPAMRLSPLLLVASLGMTTACGSGVAEPAPAAPLAPSAVEGIWVGDFRMTSCIGLRACIASINSVRPFVLRMTETASGVEGLVEIDQASTRLSGMFVNGELQLKGAATPDTPWLSAMEVRRLQLRPQPDGSLTGEIEYVEDQKLNPVGRGEIGGTLTSRERKPLGTAATGPWSGWMYVRECTQVGTPFCYPFDVTESAPLHVNVTGTSGAVTGTITIGSRAVPVTGTWSGAELQLSGTLDSVVSGGSTRTRIRSFSAERTKLGLLDATLAFDYDYVTPSGTTSSQYVAATWFVTAVAR